MRERATDPGGVPEGVRRAAAAAWAARCRFELEAEARFDRLARRLERLGEGSGLASMARSASSDERWHAALCAEQAARLGTVASLDRVRDAGEVAPAAATLRDRVLYEVVAACCIWETESTRSLAALVEAARAPGARETLQALARDEARHARLGWAYLASAHAAGRSAFLGPLVPAMLAADLAPEVLDASPGERDEEGLLALGVLPRRRRREVYERALEEVILPRLGRLGVDPGPARRWLAERRASWRPGDEAAGPAP